MNINPVGQHVLLDLFGVNKELACSKEQVSLYLTEAAHLAQATILQSHFHSFGENEGITGVLLLSESHISIHTWPEHCFVAIDIFMCGNHKITQATEYLKKSFLAKECKIKVCERGRLSGDELSY